MFWTIKEARVNSSFAKPAWHILSSTRIDPGKRTALKEHSQLLLLRGCLRRTCLSVGGCEKFLASWEHRTATTFDCFCFSKGFLGTFRISLDTYAISWAPLESPGHLKRYPGHFQDVLGTFGISWVTITSPWRAPRWCPRSALQWRPWPSRRSPRACRPARWRWSTRQSPGSLIYCCREISGQHFFSMTLLRISN